jgi:hypothetical protein
MEQLEAELGRKSDTICEMLEGVEASRLRAIRAEEIATQLRAQLSETTARLESNLKSWQASHVRSPSQNNPNYWNVTWMLAL